MDLRWSESELDLKDLDAPYPQSPIPLSKDIIQIKTPRELQRFGRSMHLCITIYHPKITQGESFFYVLNANRTSVLELRRSTLDPDKYYLNEMKTKSNMPPNFESVELIRAWLRRNEYYINMFECKFPLQGSHLLSSDERIEEVIAEYYIMTLAQILYV
jgi:hypothetical protein